MYKHEKSVQQAKVSKEADKRHITKCITNTRNSKTNTWTVTQDFFVGTPLVPPTYIISAPLFPQSFAVYSPRNIFPQSTVPKWNSLSTWFSSAPCSLHFNMFPKSPCLMFPQPMLSLLFISSNFCTIPLCFLTNLFPQLYVPTVSVPSTLCSFSRFSLNPVFPQFVFPQPWVSPVCSFNLGFLQPVPSALCSNSLCSLNLVLFQPVPSILCSLNAILKIALSKWITVDEIWKTFGRSRKRLVSNSLLEPEHMYCYPFWFLNMPHLCFYQFLHDVAMCIKAFLFFS